MRLNASFERLVLNEPRSGAEVPVCCTLLQLATERMQFI